LIPDEALEAFRRALDEGQRAQGEWEDRFDRYAEAYPDEAAVLRRRWVSELPDAWRDALPTFSPDDGPLATRKASGAVLDAISDRLPMLFGGSADLAPSTKTYLKGYDDFQKGATAGRNMHFGVREHAMGAILNGVALHGELIPYGGTFLIFTDYMRPAIRLAAMMELPVIYVWTHDSVWIGEDGPTHQPVEQLAGLRAIPNLQVIRPADANETVAAWRAALERRDGPTGLVLTRQSVPILERSEPGSAGDLERGAYVISEAAGGSPEVILIATGSEVHLAIEARRILDEAGVRARVVSMPCWKRFDAQPETYRKQVLPPEITVRLAIEAAVPLGWDRYVGPEGDVIGIERFGASAPYRDLMEQFGFTPEAVARRAMALLGKA
jgi:transketolase